MRVVAGTAGGRRLRGPASNLTRPTTDKVRGAIFNSLQSLGLLQDVYMLDLFAGTGACGIEALSRGARSVVFVERDRKALEVIRENLETTGFVSPVIASDALAYLRSLSDVEQHFDVIFADPPYSFDQWDALFENAPAAVVVCESAKGVASPNEGWECVREKRYGDTMVTIMRRTK